MTARAPSRHPDLNSIREEDEDPRSPWSALASVLGRVPAALNNANGTHPRPETPNRRVSSISRVPTMLQNQLPMDPPVTGPAMHRAIHQPTPRESIGQRKSHLPDALPHSRDVGAASSFMEPQWTSSRGLPPRQQPQHPQIASRNGERATCNGEYAGQTPFRRDTCVQHANGTVLDAQRDHDDAPFANHQPMPPSNRQSRRRTLYPDTHMQLHRSDALPHHPGGHTPLQHRISNGGASHRQPAPGHSLLAPSYTRQSATIMSHRVPSSHHCRVAPPIAPPDVNTDRNYPNLPWQSVQMRAPAPTVAPETANGIIHDPHAIAWPQPHSHNDSMARDVPFARRTALESRNGSESDSLGFLWPETTLDNVASTIDARQQLGHVSNGVHTHDNTPVHPIEAHPWPSSLTEDVESNIVVNTTRNPLHQQKQPTQTSSYIVQSPHAHANIPPQLNPNRQNATNSLCFNETYDSPFASPSFYL
ncbi:hypothetical protein BC940DRAFT_300677 [Gongronella butleri]|nr:hypothetical protein BC940DRAFT_300677 [Gongronella butleri]